MSDFIHVTKEQLSELMRQEKIESVYLLGDVAPSGKRVWSVFAYPFDKGATFVMVAGRGPSEGRHRHYTSLDRAYDAIRDMGYRWSINVDL